MGPGGTLPCFIGTLTFCVIVYTHTHKQSVYKKRIRMGGQTHSGDYFNLFFFFCLHPNVFSNGGFRRKLMMKMMTYPFLPSDGYLPRFRRPWQ